MYLNRYRLNSGEEVDAVWFDGTYPSALAVMRMVDVQSRPGPDVELYVCIAKGAEDSYLDIPTDGARSRVRPGRWIARCDAGRLRVLPPEALSVAQRIPERRRSDG